ncbi:MAG TPA: hypothetical protein VGB03_03955 [Acidimicrobiales bacterium]|jgi:hypothetical protein
MRRLLVSLGIGVGGMVALLAGLLWDALLHADDPGLAAREGLFTLSNPGHLLLAAGIALSLVGLLGAGDAALSLRAGRTWGAGGLRRGAAALASVLVLGAAATGTWAGQQGHEHEVAASGTPAGAAAGHEHGDGHAEGGHDDGHADGGAHDDSHSHGDAHSDGHGTMATGRPTAEQQAAADRLRAATMAAARRWASQDDARAEGFKPITPVLNRFQHWHNQAFFTDGRVLEPTAPEELIYASTSRGPVLVAAMFLMERVGDKGPQVGGPLTVWHDHEDLCFSSDGRVVGFYRPPRLTCPPGAVNQRTPEMLHVWIVDNPAGPFAPEMEPAALQAIAERSA